jgi:hypothetical protein
MFGAFVEELVAARAIADHEAKYHGGRPGEWTEGDHYPDADLERTKAELELTKAELERTKAEMSDARNLIRKALDL